MSFEQIICQKLTLQKKICEQELTKIKYLDQKQNYDKSKFDSLRTTHYLQMLFNPPSPQKDSLTRKKQRKQGDNNAFISNKLRIMDKNIKPQIRRKFSQNDLKQIIWTVMNKQSTELKAQERDRAKNYQENQETTQQNYLEYYKPLGIQPLDSKQSVSTLNINKQKINCDNKNGLSMNSNKLQLPSITKNRKSPQDLERCLEKDLIPKTQTQTLRNAISLDFDHSSPNNKRQKAPNFITRKKSHSMAVIKNRIKFSQIKSKFPQNQWQSQKIQSSKSSQNENEISPRHSCNQSPESHVNRRKLFHINTLNLNTKQEQNKIVTKRTFVLKLLQSNDNAQSKLQSRKSSLVNLIDRQSLTIKKASLISYQDDSIITKSITFSYPDQCLLKKIMSKIRVQENDSKKQQKQKKLTKQQMKQKLRREKINGWDIKKQDEQNIFAMDNQKMDE